jgi:hypothetical protein
VPLACTQATKTKFFLASKSFPKQQFHSNVKKVQIFFVEFCDFWAIPYGDVLFSWTFEQVLFGLGRPLDLMVRAIQTLSVLALISAGVVFVLCIVQQLQGAPEAGLDLGPPILEKFRQADGPSEKSPQETLSPLVRQAEAFALYLNPPQPPKSKEAPAPRRNLEQTNPVAKPAKLTPKFTVMGTSYYRSRPEESMALVSEPGSEPHWVKQGTHLGHFVVEKIERGTIVYQDGDRLLEMAVNTKVPIRTKQVKQTMLATNQTNRAPPKPSSPRKTNTKVHKPLYRLGLGRPETRAVAYDSESSGSG